MKKLFTLIHGNDVHLSPGVKVVKANIFSEVLDSKGILEKVQEDAIEYKKDVTAECEGLKEQAELKGFQEGMEKWSEQVAFLEKEIGKVHDEIQNIIVPLALSGAKKIFGKELELAPEAVVDIVAKNLKSVSEHRKITIYSNKKDKSYLEKGKDRLEKVFGKLESLSIQEREDVERGGCIIETEKGIINAQVENQWRALEKAFEMVLKETET